ncbi:SNF2-related protein [candidate division KSB1 bacterium]
MSTAYHSKYWAHALTLRGSGGDITSLSRSISNARVDLNPHQIDAALFALRSPFSNGVILADEVGLGKTIEAGIILSQRWAERQRRILIIVPAMLRKQWMHELEEKFYLPSKILDSKISKEIQKDGNANPFELNNCLVICSYHFASAKSTEISQIPWDMVVIDEAHRLRNVYRSRNRIDPMAIKSMAHKISDALQKRSKLLLTATPLQNSLMELFGLVSVIDDHVFGDSISFRDQFVRLSNDRIRNEELRIRLRPVCFRTLRRQVMEYVSFTKRIPITQDFLPTDAEHELYMKLSSYLQREHLYALPASQRQLITLILRKLLASSSFAIAKTLRRLTQRLEDLKEQIDLIDEEDLEGIEELNDEWQENNNGEMHFIFEIDPIELKNELEELRQYADMAEKIQINAKGEALIPALKLAFEKAESLGAQRKAVIFTESRRTQQYLAEYLSENGYANQLATINGSNNDAISKDIYRNWLAKHEGQDIITGSKPVDLKAAIIEHFKDNASILIATEAAAEGVNLQFASLVVNYDLPWNPQRIEQRIGRCHRYGQKHDVVVVNFINRRNEADQRVFQLLNEKFHLFDGVFGASDEILGAIESGVDIERRIAQVFQECRTSQEIQLAFDFLQSEFDIQIQSRLAETRRTLLEHFDEDVRSRLRLSQQKTLDSLSAREKWLLNLTREELKEHSQFDNTLPRFQYTGPDFHNGMYNLDWKNAEQQGDHFYRQDHPLAQQLIERAIDRSLKASNMTLNYTGYDSKISILEPLIGQSGWMEVSKLTVESLKVDEFLVFAALSDSGQRIDEEICTKLMQLDGNMSELTLDIPDLSNIRQEEIQVKLDDVDKSNSQYFDEEVLKLDRWSEDLKQGLERDIKELDKQIREARKTAAMKQALNDKLSAQKVIKNLEKKRNTKRRELFDAQDAIDNHREQLIKNIEKQLKQNQSIQELFTIRWTLI